MANRKFKIGGVSADSAKAEARSATPIYDENQGPPPKGPYRVLLKNITGGEVASGKNEGKPKFRMVAEIAEPNGTKKAKFNGFPIWYHMVITDENAGNVNQFLDVITDGKPKSTKDKVRQAFWSGNVMADEKDVIVKIGSFTVPTEVACAVNATAKPAQGQYPAGLNLGDLYPVSDLPDPEAADEDDDEDEDDDTDAEETEDDAEEGDAEERAEELEEMSLADLKKVAKEHGIKTIKKDAETLVEEILAAEFPEDDEDEDDEEEEEGDEDDEDDEDDEEEDPRAELEGLTLAKLKARAKEEGYKLADYKGLDKDGLVDLILGEESDDEDEDEEDEEEEPEPPKKKARGTAARRTKGKRPPF